MSTTSKMNPPPVMWAQNPSMVFLTFNLEDCKDPVLKLEKESVYFKGIGGTDKKEYEVKIDLYKSIDTEKSKIKASDRNIELNLIKEDEKSGYWPTLTKDGLKKPWLKCDFNKWNDEFDSDECNSSSDLMKDLYKYGSGDNGFDLGNDKASFDDFSPDSDEDDKENDKDDIPDLE